MRRFRQLPLVCLALALWLAGTQHCALEAAGLLDGFGIAIACDSDGDQHCVTDGCDSVENGAYRTADHSIDVSAPDARCPDCLLCLALLAPPTEAPISFATTTPVAHDLGWVPARHFERRAAPPSRAPSALLA